MKRSLKTKLLTILLSLAMLFTMMPIVTNTINAADEIELVVGAEYKLGDKIKLSQDAYIYISDDLNSIRQFEANSYIISEGFSWDEEIGWYQFPLYAVSNPNVIAFYLYLGYGKGYTGSSEERARIIGIKCVGGEGTELNPYKFDLLLTDKVIEVGTVYTKGEKISFPKVANIVGNDRRLDIIQQVIIGEYTVGDFTWIEDDYKQYSCDTNFKLASGTLDLKLGYGKGYTGSAEEQASIIGIKCISGSGMYSDPYTFAIEFASPTTTHKVTYNIVNGTWSDGKNNPITEDVKEGEKPSSIPTGMQPTSDEYPVGSWDIDPSTVTSITGDTEFTYTFSASDAMILTVTPYEGEYDGVSHGTAATANVDGAIIQYSTDDGENWSTTVPTRKDAGTTEVKVKAIATGYVEKTAKYNLKIIPKSITITTGSASKEYDSTPLTNDNVTIEGLVNNETATVKATGSQTELGSSTNTYSIDWGTTNSSNYDITEILGTLTVSKNKTEITLTAASYSKTYDGTPLTNSNVTVTGLPTGFKVVNVRMTSESTITDVGTKANEIESYVIRDSAGIDMTVNFTNVTTVAGTLEITRKSVIVKADDKTKTFGDADPELTATVKGLLQGDKLSYTLSREPGEVVDKYEITATGEEEQGNYIVSYEGGTFTITPATYTVTYKVVNGTLSDGTSTSTTETVEHGKTPSNIPTNLIPNEGCEDGSWDVDPTTASIIERTTFTYTFVKKKYDVTYKIVNGKWSDGKTDPIKVSVEHGDSPTQIPTGMEPISDKYENGSWNIDPSTVASVTGNTEFTYTFVKKADPTVITYKNTAGNNGTWTKGDTDTLNFTFKRTPDVEQSVYKESFDHIEVDGTTVGKSNYEIGYGSIIIKLLPSYLDTLSVNTTHTLMIVFKDGSVTTNFTIKEKGNNNNSSNTNSKSYYIPKTGVE